MTTAQPPVPRLTPDTPFSWRSVCLAVASAAVAAGAPALFSWRSMRAAAAAPADVGPASSDTAAATAALLPCASSMSPSATNWVRNSAAGVILKALLLLDQHRATGTPPWTQIWTADNARRQYEYRFCTQETPKSRWTRNCVRDALSLAPRCSQKISTIRVLELRQLACRRVPGFRSTLPCPCASLSSAHLSFSAAMGFLATAIFAPFSVAYVLGAAALVLVPTTGATVGLALGVGITPGQFGAADIAIGGQTPPARMHLLPSSAAHTE